MSHSSLEKPPKTIKITPRPVLRLLYNLLLPPLALVATPFWLLKTRKRNGLSRRLYEKIARYDENSPEETKEQRRPVYLHAVSVGEVNIARKLITQWAIEHPEERFLLAIGTSTGFDLALQAPPPQTEVLYAPLDIPTFTNKLFSRYKPALVVLIEHEVWPNLMATAEKNKVPVALANARLSTRSGERLKKLEPLLGSIYSKLSWVGAQSEADKPRLSAIGIRENSLQVTGSIKFDPAQETPSTSDFDPLPLLNSLGDGPILMALSTHAGEEIIFAKAAFKIPDARIVIIPRHMERRKEITTELESAGFKTILRSTGLPLTPSKLKSTILIVDSTGEMPAFTKHALLAFIGKTFSAQGGQNPCEAIAAGVPVIAGPHLENFEPLATELRTRQSILTVSNEEELAKALASLSKDSPKRSHLSQSALSALESHRGATKKTIESLAKLLNQT